MQQQIKVGSIIEILNHDSEATDEGYKIAYPIGSQWEVLVFHPETGEVEVEDVIWPPTVTFFPGEYKLVE
ncbi:hypothetical protein IBHPHPPA_00030 [Salmonella phage KKP 3828]|uniref:Uncharacterized protein n=1 Tax=Salmonella phage KKP 3828 TaxID=3041358 RepID=A0AA50F398_9CAUD|nr:hypothetical protein IBHPHPPA_00030 [Salmonella phage KKP 3828]